LQGKGWLQGVSAQPGLPFSVALLLLKTLHSPHHYEQGKDSMSSRFCVFVFLFFVFLHLPAFAAQVAPGSRELIQDRQQRLLDQQQQRLEQLQQLPGVESPAATMDGEVEEVCHPVRRIRLVGVTLLDGVEQKRLLEPFVGQCLGVSRLNELLKVITSHYLDRGYVTSRAYLPPQDLADGELAVQVIEGRLQQLDGTSIASDRELALAYPGAAGDLLDLRQLEQLLDQLNRLPSLQAELNLLPGEVPGESRVKLVGQRQKAWRLGASRNNEGLPETGEQQWGLGFEWDSPLGLADQLVLRGTGDTISDSHRQSDSQSLFYSLPYGWWTFNYSYNQNSSRSRFEAAGFEFQQSGDSQTQQLRGERVLARDQVSKTAASVAAGYIRTRNYLEDTLLDVSSQDLSSGQLGFNHGRRFGSIFVNLDLGWQRGTDWFGAQGNGDPQGAMPVARYNLYTATLSYLQPFRLWGESFSVQSLATGQHSEDVLFSPLRISIGGLTSVRGFKEQSLTGDSGGYWRNQLNWRRPIGWAPLQPWLNEYGAALAYDVGVIEHGPHNPLAHGRMSGQALELHVRGPHLAASVTLAQSLDRPSTISKAESPLYFRVELFF
jgi:hemolysin activation/secretion protein